MWPNFPHGRGTCCCKGTVQMRRTSGSPPKPEVNVVSWNCVRFLMFKQVPSPRFNCHAISTKFPTNSHYEFKWMHHGILYTRRICTLDKGLPRPAGDVNWRACIFQWRPSQTASQNLEVLKMDFFADLRPFISSFINQNWVQIWVLWSVASNASITFHQRHKKTVTSSKLI